MLDSASNVNTGDLAETKKTLCKLMGYGFILSCLNPWTSFGTNSMDSQPWSLFAGLLFIIFARHIRVPPYFSLLFVSITLGSVFSLMLSRDPAIEDIARFVASYAILLAVYIGFYNFLHFYGFPRKIFILAGWSWIFFALVEIVAPSVTSALSPQRTSEGRGLTSLAPEPTFFAIFLIFFSWILYKGTSEKFKASEKVIVFISLLSVLMLARSTMGVLYLLVGASVFLTGMFFNSIIRGQLKKRHIIIFVSVAAVVVSTFYFIDSFMPESRVNKIISSFAEVEVGDVVTIVRMDRSIFTRVAHATVSVHAAFLNFGLPGGIDTFLIKSREAADLWGELFWDFHPGNKIQSWNGVLLYELGIFGLISYVALIFAARREGGASFAEIVIVILFLVGAIPIAFSLAPMLFALWAYLADKATLPLGAVDRDVAPSMHARPKCK